MNAIIVLNYNDADNVEQYISRMKEVDTIDYIVIVDNCSTDDSYNRLIHLANETIYVIKSDGNKGYAYGNNFGIRFIETKHPDIDTIVISNPDIYIESDSFNSIIKALDSYDMVTGKIFNYNPTTESRVLVSNLGWRVHNYAELIRDHFLLLYKINKSVFRNSNYLIDKEISGKKSIQVEAIPGCFFAIKRNVFDSIGLFDERTFLFGEEQILGYKMKSHGYKVGIILDSIILHANSVTIKKNIKKRREQERIRLESDLIYIKYYLGKSKFEISLYKVLYWLAREERSLLMKIYSIIRKR